MVSYFVIWCIQFPLPLIPPHRYRWLFTAKVIMMSATILGMLVWICVKAGSGGEIWEQEATVSGRQESSLIIRALNSCTASWSTVGVNIADFIRYITTPKQALTTGLWFPLIRSFIAIIGIVVTSVSGVVFGEYLWNLIAIIDQ